MRDLIRALRNARLDAIIVGTVAAALQGAPVTTQDVDILVRDTKLNRRKLKAVCSELGAAEAPLSDLHRGLTLAGAAFPVDVLLNQISGGLTFESLKSRKREVKIGAETAVVADLADVIRSKEAAARPKDLAQLPILKDTLKVRDALEASTRK